MIDKLDLRIPRQAEFTPLFGRLYGELRAQEKGPFHATRGYEFTGDLRGYGFNARLNLLCRGDSNVGNHKLELIDVGKMSRPQILQEIAGIFDVDAYSLEVMRADYAVDLTHLPVQWFRESVRVEHKRHRAAVMGERYYSEKGTGDIQTLYFGKRPNTIRIYDKLAEYMHRYRTMVRYLGKDVELPSFESLYGISNQGSILTRVERQIGGRIPAEIGTLRQVIDSGSGFRPFSKVMSLATWLGPLRRFVLAHPLGR
jgi:hypothetical protein